MPSRWTCASRSAGASPAFGADWSRKLGPDRVVSLDVLGSVSKSALTADLPMGTRPDGLPATFVPGRNLVFLTFAAIVAYQRGLKHVVAGVCETDFSGYPDCRDDTVKALQVAINLGMEARLVLETPLMWIDKADTWRLAETLGGRALVDLIVEETHTCYLGDRAHRHDWGVGCGTCDACRLRANGWARYRPDRPLETAISTPKSTAAVRLQQGPHICFGMLLQGGRDDANWRSAAQPAFPNASPAEADQTTAAIRPPAREEQEPLFVSPPPPLGRVFPGL